MFCSSCGTENANDAKFCTGCGKVLNSGNGQEPKIIPAQRNSENSTGETSNLSGVNTGQAAEKTKSFLIKIIIGACAAIAALLIIIFVASNASATIDLNKYLTFETEGYDGFGTVRAVIDWGAVSAEYGDKISFTKQAKNEFGGFLAIMTPMDAVQESVSIHLEESSRLSNGTTIAYTWNVDENLSKYVKCKVKYEEGTYMVSGLTEVGSFDAFADLTVEYSGIAPDGNANLNYLGSELSYYDFTCDKSKGLSNGDTVKVTIDEGKLEYYAKNLGKVPEALEKEYIVEGLSSYLAQISELDDESLALMQQQASDVYNAYTARTFSEGEEHESLTYIGNYLLTIKDKNTLWGNINVLYLVYKAQVRNTNSYGGDTYNKVNDIYWFISFNNLMVEPDGKITVDVTHYNTPNETFTIDSGVSYNGWGSTKSWYYYGYPTLDELYKDVITSNMDSFNHEDNVDESVAPETVAEAETEDDVIEDGYVFANSDKELLSKSDLTGLTAEECKIARNEIYARHGRKFKDAELQAYFNACDWYEGTIGPDDFKESDLNDIEIANKDLIVAYEEEMGYR